MEPEDDAEDAEFDAEVAYAHSPSAAAIDQYEHSVELTLVLPEDDAATPPRVWRVDERLALSTFKEKVAAFLEKPAGEFRLFAPASRYAAEPTELTRLTLSLRSNFLDSGTRVTVRYGQALGVGETRVEVHLFTPWRGAGDTDTAALFKPLLPAAVAREGDTVAAWRAKLLADPAVAAAVTVPAAQVRLREKSYTGCGAVLLDAQVVGKDVVLYIGKQFLLEQLDGPEPKTEVGQRVGVVRRWRPSSLSLDAHEPILLPTNATIGTTREMVAAMSGIPLENTQVMKVYGGYPDEENVLEIQDDYGWDGKDCSPSLGVSVWPWYLSDGFCLFYRDKTEAVKVLSEAEKAELAKTQAKKKSATYSYSYTPRKEKGVTIKSREKPVVVAATAAASDGAAAAVDGLANDLAQATV